MTVDLAHPAVSMEMLSRLLDQVASALFAVDATGRVILMNEGAAAALRISADEAVGSSLHDGGARTPEFAAMGKVLLACLADPRTRRRQTAEVHTGETVRSLGYTVAPLLADDGALEGAVAIFTDLTDVKERRRRQLETERFAEVGRVASWMAHEVKNPLATIQMYAQLCSRSIGEEHQDSVKVIREQVSLAQSRISDMLRTLSLREGENRKLAVTDLGSVAREYLDREARGLPHVTFDSRIQDGQHRVPVGQGDALSLVSNLVTNSAEAMEAPGTIRLDLVSAEGRTRLVVEDSGPGFPDDDPHRLLQPFFTTKKRGTGLGLWVVKRICETAGGSLVLSNTVDGGARVTVTLPHIDLEDIRGKTVLVVDDDPSLRRLLSRQLSAFGAETVEAAGGHEAAAVAAARHIDAVVSDVNMPGGGGYELLNKLPSGTPTLMISGLTGAEDDRGLRKGVAFLMKPFSAEELGLALSYLLWEVTA